MKKLVFLIAAFSMLSGYCLAQAGNNQVAVGVSTDFLLGPGYRAAYGIGFGGNVKGLYGIGPGQATFTVAYSSFGGKSGTEFYTGGSLGLLPVLVGYRYTLPSNFYGEAQAGFGILTQHLTGMSYTQTDPAAAVNVGYTINGFDISARFYTEGTVQNQFAIRLAYNFSLK